jgi:hypothetical protein
MWINLDEKQLDLIKEGVIALAEGNERDAKLFWTEDVRDTRERLEGEAKAYRGIANKIDETKADFDPADPYRATAKGHVDDDFEVDDDAVVSPGGDPGAWVMSWLWITDKEAGVETEDEDDEDTCRTCGAEYEAGGDGFDGECPDCADKTDQKLHPENYED